MYPEKRKEDRSTFTRQPQGKLQVLAGEHIHHVSEVVDVSHMGIRLKVDARLDIGQGVRIQYEADGVDLKLNGTVIWHSDEPAHSVEHNANPSVSIIGVELTSPSLLEAFWGNKR